MSDVRMPEGHEIKQRGCAPKPRPRDLDEKTGGSEGAPLLRNCSRRRFGNRHFIVSHSLHGDLMVAAGLSTNDPVCTATQSALQTNICHRQTSLRPKPSPPFPAKSAVRSLRSAFGYRLPTLSTGRPAVVGLALETGRF